MYEGGAFSELPVAQKTTTAAPVKVTVEKGDTLSSIAKENNTTVKEILAANPKFTEDPKYKNGNMIWSGTTVKIPTKAPTGGIKTDSSSQAKGGTVPGTTNGQNGIPGMGGSGSSGFGMGGGTQSDGNTGTSGSGGSTPVWAGNYNPGNNNNNNNNNDPVKTATPDLILYNDEGNELEAFADLLFEQLGGQELLTVARHDTVNGQDVVYQPIKNLGILQNEFNPNSLLKLQESLYDYFNNYDIELFDKIPKVGNGIDGNNVYLDTDGNLILEFINLAENEQIDIEIANDGTIYEAEI